MSIQTFRLQFPFAAYTPPSGALLVQPAGVNLHGVGKFEAAIGDQPYQPYMLASQINTTTGTTGNTAVYEADFDGMRLRSGAWDGGEAIVYREADGAVTEVRRSTVTRFVNNRLRSQLKGSAGAGSTLIWPTATASTAVKISVLGDTDYRPSACTTYLLCFSVSSDGTSISAPVSATMNIPAEAARAGSAVNETDTPISSGVTVSAFTLADVNENLPAPVSVSVSTAGDGNFTVEIVRPADETGIQGYALCSIEDADWSDGWNRQQIDLAPHSEALQAGDIIHVRKVILEPSRNLTFNDEGNNATTLNFIRGPGALEFTDTPLPGISSQRFVAAPAGFPGDAPYVAEFVLDGAAGSDGRTIGFSADIDKAGGLSTGKTYKMQCYARCTAGSVTARARRSDYAPHGLADIDTVLTSEWQLIDHSFSPSVTTTTETAAASWRFIGTGTIQVANLRYFEDSVGFRGLSSREAADLADSGIEWVRHHFSAKPDRWRCVALENFLSLDSSADPSGLWGKVTLPMALRWQEAAGINKSWIILPHWFSLEDHLAVAAYLFEPFDPEVDSATAKPWSARRHAHGHTSPYTDIILEFSNETWNAGTFFPWSFTATTEGQRTYARFANRIFTAMAALSYWPTSGAEFMIAGQAAQIGVTVDPAAGTASAATAISVADYVGGVDGGQPLRSDTIDDYLTATLVGTRTATARSPLLKAISDDQVTAFGDPLKLMIYEGGPGSNSPITEPAITEESEVMKSAAMAVGVFGMLCEYAARGVSPFMWFELLRGQNTWSSHLADGREAPAWRMLRLFNEHIAGKSASIITPSSGVTTWEYWTAGGINKASFPLARIYRADIAGSTVIAAVNMSLPFDTLPTDDRIWTYNSTDNLAMRTETGFLSPVFTTDAVVGDSLSHIKFEHTYNTHNLDSGTLDVTTTSLSMPASRTDFTLSGSGLGLATGGMAPSSAHLWVFA